MSQDQLGRLTFSFPDLNGEQKLRELILYVSGKCQDDPTFGATKLNKILYFADFLSFREHGKPITGVEYMRLGQGPVPKRLVPVRKKMRAEGILALETRKFYDRDQQRPVPLRDAYIDTFTPTEIALVDEIIRLLWGRRATEVSSLSHGIAWIVPHDRESIPYEAAFLSDQAPTEEELIRVRELVNEHGWRV